MDGPQDVNRRGAHQYTDVQYTKPAETDDITAKTASGKSVKVTTPPEQDEADSGFTSLAAERYVEKEYPDKTISQRTAETRSDAAKTEWVTFDTPDDKVVESFSEEAWHTPNKTILLQGSAWNDEKAVVKEEKLIEEELVKLDAMAAELIEQQHERATITQEKIQQLLLKETQSENPGEFKDLITTLEAEVDSYALKTQVKLDKIAQQHIQLDKTSVKHRQRELGRDTKEKELAAMAAELTEKHNKRKDSEESKIQQLILRATQRGNATKYNKKIEAIRADIAADALKTQRELKKITQQQAYLNKKSVRQDMREWKQQEQEKLTEQIQAVKNKATTQKKQISSEQQHLNSQNRLLIKEKRQQLKVLRTDKTTSARDIKEGRKTLENEIFILNSRIRLKAQETKEKLAAIDEQLDKDMELLTSSPQLDRWVTSAANMPFTVIPKGEINSSEVDSNEDVLFQDAQGFSDAAPLLTRKEEITSYEPKRDQHGKPVRKMDENGQLILKLDENGEILMRSVVIMDPDTGETTTVNRPVYEYEPDLSKPITAFSYDANTDPTAEPRLIKKKLKQYKVNFFANALKKTLGKVRSAWHTLRLSASARAQRMIDSIRMNSKSVFYQDLQMPVFTRLFKRICSKKYKKDVTGLQQMHDLVSVVLSTHIGFTQREEPKYKDAMASLLLVGAGLMDARAPEGDEFDYHLLEPPVKQLTGESLSELTADEYNQVLQQAQQKQKRRRMGRIGPKHIRRIEKIMIKVLEAKIAAKEANLLALQQGRTQDYQDADEVAKQTLINLVKQQASAKLPEDLDNKLEAMLDNMAPWSVPGSGLFDDSTHESIPPAIRQTVPTNDEFIQLTKQQNAEQDRLQWIEQGLQTMQQTLDTLDVQIAAKEAVLSQPAVDNQDAQEAELAELKEQQVRLWEELENASSDLQKKEAKIDELEAQKQELIAIESQQEERYSTTKTTVDRILSETSVLTGETCDLITQAIMAHSGIVVPGPISSEVSNDPTTLRSKLEAYNTVSKLRIASHQQEIAKAKAREIADYVNSGNFPTAEGVYELLTNTPTVSATEPAREKFTEKTPPHFLHASDCKKQLVQAFRQEELAAHPNRAGRSDSTTVTHEAVNNDVRDILKKSGRLISDKKHKKYNEPLATVLSMHVVVANRIAKLKKPQSDEDTNSELISISKEIDAKQVADARRMAHELVNAMNRSDVTINELAKVVYPKSRSMRARITNELGPHWVS